MSSGVELIESWYLNGNITLFFYKRIEYTPFYQSAGYQNISIHMFINVIYV